MAITINSIQDLQNYLRGVLDRAARHAGNVEEVALAILGAIIWGNSLREYKSIAAIIDDNIGL